MSSLARIPQRICTAVALLILLLAGATHFAPTVSASTKPHADVASNNSCPSPPANFDPLTASTAQLRYYGLPLYIPGTDRNLWANTLRHAKHRICTPSINTHRYSQPGPEHTSGVAGSSSNNWSGYATSGGTYLVIQAYWIAPTYNGSKSPSNSRESSWVGLGGWGGGNLLQAGTTADPADGYQFWWEEYPKNYQQIVPGVLCFPGDQMFVAVSYNDNNPQQDWVDAEDIYCNTYWDHQVDTNFQPSKTAEWIDERSGCSTSDNSKVYALSDFQTVPWSYGVIGLPNNGTQYLGGTQLTMIDFNDNNLQLTSPGSVNSSNHGFTDTWKANGKDEGC